MKTKYLVIIVLLMFFTILLKNVLFKADNQEIILGDSNVIGDVNLDGKVKASDYILIKKHILGISKLTGDKLKKADVNSDGKVNVKDYIIIKKIILGVDVQIETKYTITFNANGGSVSTKSKEIKNKDKYGSMPIPTRTGYVFVGWFTTKDDSFDSKYYGDHNKDVKNALGDNYQELLIHWLDYGMSEGRICNSSYRKYDSVFNKSANETLYAGWVSLSTLYNNRYWNKYSITYSSSVPLKGTMVYKSNKESETTETFFLEPATSGKFDSFINYWVDGSVATGIKSIKIEDFSGKAVNVNDIKLNLAPSAPDYLNTYTHSASDYNSKTVFISNDYITLGISLEWGGVVTYLSGSSKTFSNGIVNQNVVNTWDDGREIQDSLYGNTTYKGKSFGPIGHYNPVQGGNTNNEVNNGSKIVNFTIDNSKKTITIVSRPLLWSVNNYDYITEHSKEYSGYLSEGYIYQTYKLVENRVELTHSYIDFSNNYSDSYNCSGHTCPHAEVPVIYTTGNLNVLKYKDITNGNETVINQNSNFDDSVNKIKIVRARYAGLYTSNDQGIGMYIRNLESYSNYGNLGSEIYFHANFRFVGSSSSSSKSGDTIMLHLLKHIKYAKAKRIELPSVVMILGSYSDLEGLTKKYK